MKKPISQTAAAKKLGVTREHLNRVLRGHRHSRRLMSAWQALHRTPNRAA
jgi:plasmid maintenance system antidote protein VapI